RARKPDGSFPRPTAGNAPCARLRHLRPRSTASGSGGHGHDTSSRQAPFRIASRRSRSLAQGSGCAAHRLLSRPRNHLAPDRRHAARTARRRVSTHRRRSAMTGMAARPAHGRPHPDGPAPFTTLIELTFQKQKVEHWIRFGRKSFEQIIDRRRSIVGFAPESVFAFVRWASNDYGTIVSRLDLLRP